MHVNSSFVFLFLVCPTAAVVRTAVIGLPGTTPSSVTVRGHDWLALLGLRVARVGAKVEVLLFDVQGVIAGNPET